jgi:rRNA maturation endonuclease Nob1
MIKPGQIIKITNDELFELQCNPYYYRDNDGTHRVKDKVYVIPCAYCGRTKQDPKHKTCDGCGADATPTEGTLWRIG